MGNSCSRGLQYAISVLVPDCHFSFSHLGFLEWDYFLIVPFLDHDSLSEVPPDPSSPFECFTAFKGFDHYIFSSPEPKAQRGAYRIGRHPAAVRPSSVRRRPPFSKIFSSETAWPIKAKFYVKHL